MILLIVAFLLGALFTALVLMAAAWATRVYNRGRFYVDR